MSVPNLLSAQVAHASTIGQGDRIRSEASVANLALTVNGNSIGAAFLMSKAMAACGTGGPSASGSSEIAELAADIDGTPGTYKVDVADNGNPGRNVDLFSLTLSTGYSVSAFLGGGNIQLHTPCE